MRPFWFLIGCVTLAWLPCASVQSSPATADLTLPWVTQEAKAPQVVYRTFESKTIGGRVSYHAYIPQAYDRPGARLPVLYWLHGTSGGIAGIRPVAEHFDGAIKAGQVPAMIVVFVNGLPARLWADSKDGASPVETVFITEVIPEVDRAFRTIAERKGRILEGFSMGGYGAARLGFRHSHLFAGISILAGGPFDLELKGPRALRNPRLREQLLRDVCSNDPEYFRAISPWMIAESAAADLREQKTKIRHVVGTLDNTHELNRLFHERMAALQIPHDFNELPNIGHDAQALLRMLGERNGEFYRQALAD